MGYAVPSGPRQFAESTIALPTTYCKFGDPSVEPHGTILVVFEIRQVASIANLKYMIVRFVQL